MRVKIRRLPPKDADAIVDCFRRVYGESYANELFYDPARLAAAMAEGRIGSVGAEAGGRLLGHMAMTVHPGARHVELGNTVVDPAARGHGLAWQVGAELKAWCIELGYRGYLHYPTTAHHVMQRQSVSNGFETGLMLGYIPAETDGHTGARSRGRQAATIVYEALTERGAMGASQACYLPEDAADLVRDLAAPTGLGRSWRIPAEPTAGRSRTHLAEHPKRGLARLTVARVGADLTDHIQTLQQLDQPCRQIDFRMDDLGIGAGFTQGRDAGFWFCGWLPGYASTDVVRLQQVDRATTEMAPSLVNRVARNLLKLAPSTR